MLHNSLRSSALLQSALPVCPKIEQHSTVNTLKSHHTFHTFYYRLIKAESHFDHNITWCTRETVLEITVWDLSSHCSLRHRIIVSCEDTVWHWFCWSPKKIGLAVDYMRSWNAYLMSSLDLSTFIFQLWKLLFCLWKLNYLFTYKLLISFSCNYFLILKENSLIGLLLQAVFHNFVY